MSYIPLAVTESTRAWGGAHYGVSRSSLPGLPDLGATP
jgi:hypothetical protein